LQSLLIATLFFLPLAWPFISCPFAWFSFRPLRGPLLLDPLRGRLS
jgi:hypothetical protein